MHLGLAAVEPVYGAARPLAASVRSAAAAARPVAVSRPAAALPEAVGLEAAYSKLERTRSQNRLDCLPSLQLEK